MSLSEDCLYLNVYTPLRSGNGLRGNSTLLPVMVFIHGVRVCAAAAAAAVAAAAMLGVRSPCPFCAPQGRFEQGGIDTPLYDGRIFVNKANVVLVTLQYRLGALGFLTVGNITGNFAIKVGPAWRGRTHGRPR